MGERPILEPEKKNLSTSHALNQVQCKIVWEMDSPLHIQRSGQHLLSAEFLREESLCFHVKVLPDSWHSTLTIIFLLLIWKDMG